MDVMEDLRQRFEAMKYQELRQEAKKHGVKANLKKADMVDQLVEVLENQHIGAAPAGDAAINGNDQEEADENSFHTAKTQSDDESANENTENMPGTEEKLNRTFEINDSEHSELLKTLGDVAEQQKDQMSGETVVRPPEGEMTAQSPMIRPRKRPETIAKHFANLHEKLTNTNETLDSFMERKRARHASLTRGIPSRVAELAKPKNAQGAHFEIGDIDKLNLDFSKTLITPKSDKMRRASSHNALNRAGLPTPLTPSDKNNSRSVDRLRLEILAKPKRSIHGSAMEVDSVATSPKKTPILRNPKLKRSSSLGPARRNTQVAHNILDFDGTPEPQSPAVAITPRIEQLAKPKPAAPVPVVPKGSKLQRTQSYKAYAKPYKYTDTTKMSDAQYKEYLANLKKDST
uniref:SAP domain-containing protein n=1 Tax=Panagrellus redivivus TaxID=6233 RepID=A0A7E4VN12_PANRE